MLRDQTRKPVGMILCLLCVWGLATMPIQAQDQRDDPDEIKAVFRISRQFLDDVTDEKIIAEIPFCATVLGFECTGVIHGEGNITVDLQSSSDKAIFSVDSQGNGYACVKGVRRLFVAEGSAGGPFTSRTLVQFDGREFVHLRSIPCVAVHGNLQGVTSRRDRRIGRALGAGALLMGEHFVPRAEAQAKPIAEYILQRYTEETADQIIARLNEKTPVQESVDRLFPEMKDWVFQMSSDVETIQAAFGPPDVEVPVLPDIPDRMDNLHVEAWLRSTNEEAKLLEDLSQQPLAKQLVDMYLESTLPDLAALGEEISVTAIGDWVVIGVGTPNGTEKQ